MDTSTCNEWYSVHLPAELPATIARAANERNMSPGEFLALAVQRLIESDASDDAEAESHVPAATQRRFRPDLAAVAQTRFTELTH